MKTTIIQPTYWRYISDDGLYRKGDVYQLQVGTLNGHPAIFLPQYQPYRNQLDFDNHWQKARRPREQK